MMRHLATLLALAVSALAACAPGDRWSSRVEEPERMPEPPEHLFRQPPDFRLYDPHVRKEFYLYFYEDETVRQEMVTVINHALPDRDRRPRLATREEHDYAIAIFIEDWRSRGQAEKIRYFNERYRQEQARRATLLDDQIRFKAEAILDLEETLLGLEADLKSRESTGTFAGGDAKFNLPDSGALKNAIARTGRELYLSKGQLLILEYFRALRDSAYARAAFLMVENTTNVGDLLPNYSEPQRLADEIKQKVLPQSWLRPNATISISGAQLTVVQTRDVILAVREYVDFLRVDFARRAKEKAPVKAAPTAAPN